MKCTLLFTGDIMSQIEQDHACKTETGYDFSQVLVSIRSLLHDSDLTVGNLETIFAGEDAQYSFIRYSFNTPDALAYQLKEDGFGLLSTANNHCLDRDFAGLYRTLDVLDKVGIPHTGTARSAQEQLKTCIHTCGGMRIGFLSYTYGVNSFVHQRFVDDDHRFAVNLTQPEETLPGAINFQKPGREERFAKHYLQPDEVFESSIRPRLEDMKQEFARLRENGAEYVIMLLHCGGQHDPEPDVYTRWLVKQIIGMGADAIITNHQHVLHPFTVEDGIPVAWCLGNLIQTPPTAANACSALLKLTLEKRDGAIRPVCIAAIATKSVYDEKGRTVVKTIRQLIAEGQEQPQTLQHVVNLLRCQPEETPVEDCDEYTLFEN